MGIKKEFRKRENKEVYIPYVWNPQIKQKVYGTQHYTKADAEIEEDEMKLALKKKQNISKPEKMKLNKVADMYFGSIEDHLSSTTVQSNKDHYRIYIKKVFGDRIVQSISSVEIENYKTLLRKHKKYSPATINKTINIMSKIFQYAVSPLKIIKKDENPMTGIKRLKVTPPKHTIWTPDQVKYFLNHPKAKESDYYLMYCISLMFGCRPSEVCGLKKSDFTSDGLSINEGLNRHGEKTNLKTSGSHRFIPLVDELHWLRELLENYVKQTSKERLSDPDYGNNNYLFIHPKSKKLPEGNPVRPDVLSKNFKKLLKTISEGDLNVDGELNPGCIKLPDITLYECRHTFATIQIMNVEESNVRVAAHLLGNSPEVLMRNYAHVSAGIGEKAVSGYSKIISR